MIMMLLLLTTSCNEPSLIGGEVISPDRTDVEFTDTLTLRASAVKGDSVRTYNEFDLLNTYLCGNFDDPIFGNSKSTINTQLRLTGQPDSTVFLNHIPNNAAFLDSVILVLEYDTARFYGFLDNEDYDVDLTVSLLDEDMDINSDYYSDQDFDEGETLVSTNINPSDFVVDSSYLLVSDSDTIYPPLVRIAIDKNHNLIQNFLFNQDSWQYYSDEAAFLQILKGIKIKVEDSSTSKDLMMAFNLRSSAAGLYLYYRYPDTENPQALQSASYRFQVNTTAAQMVFFEHDYTNSPVNSFIDNNMMGDSLVFMQGMAGLNTKISIPYVRDLQNIIINQAQLELTIASLLPNDNSVYYDDPITQLLISKKNEEGNLEVISDLSLAIQLSNVIGVFGGNLSQINSNNTTIQKYTMNITDHLQDIIDGVEPSDEIFVTAFSKAQNVQRGILFGPGHSTYPAKLNLTYTINQ